jgi:hypothetical protein
MNGKNEGVDRGNFSDASFLPVPTSEDVVKEDLILI